MAFEDLYYQSPSFGLLNMRYQPKDKRMLPSTAIFHSDTIPGNFCLAKVETAYGVLHKKNLSSDVYLFIKDKLLSEIEVSIAAMEPELQRVREKEKTLDAGHKAGQVSAKAWQEFMCDEKGPIKLIRRSAGDMTLAIRYWDYKEGLCTFDAV